MPLQTLAPGSTADEVVAVMQRDGACIVSDAVADDLRSRMTGELQPYLDRTPMGTDDFSGKSTQRTGALVARTPACRAFVTHPAILGAAESFLAPYTERILLHLTQSIHIHPGQGAQVLHRDRLAWGTHLPRSIEPQFNTIWALTDFTAANGATRVVPGSQKWDWKRRAEPSEICQAEMTAGSVLLYSGSVLHSGGQNRSNASRLGLNITYCLGWLRQEENQYLSCPPHIARDLDPELQELLGYTQGNYALGYFSDPDYDPTNGEHASDILPAEMAVGRKPRKGLRFSIASGSDDGNINERVAESDGQI